VRRRIPRKKERRRALERQELREEAARFHALLARVPGKRLGRSETFLP
jgi:hypothetical protein